MSQSSGSTAAIANSSAREIWTNQTFLGARAAPVSHAAGCGSLAHRGAQICLALLAPVRGTTPSFRRSYLEPLCVGARWSGRAEEWSRNRARPAAVRHPSPMAGLTQVVPNLVGWILPRGRARAEHCGLSSPARRPAGGAGADRRLRRTNWTALLATRRPRHHYDRAAGAPRQNLTEPAQDRPGSGRFLLRHGSHDIECLCLAWSAAS